jgi:pimeloyl-ACP methyl ester carboxylesterase
MLRAFGSVFGEQTGTGAPRVLALPGWMRRRTDFDAVLAGVDAIALDLPDFGGATPEPAEAMGAAGYAAAVTPALQACADGVVLLGHSFGGRVAVHLAADHPDRVAAVVLTGVPLLHRAGRPSQPPAWYRAVRWLNRKGIVADHRMDALRNERASADYRNASGVMRGVLVTVVNEEYDDVLARVHQPVELVWGDPDPDVPVEVAERAASLFGGPARLTLVPGAGHLTTATAVPALREALHRHLA